MSGGAYGRTGNIWSQLSGRSGCMDPMDTVAGHTAKLVSNSDAMLRMLSGGGSGGSSTGATIVG